MKGKTTKKNSNEKNQKKDMTNPKTSSISMLSILLIVLAFILLGGSFFTPIIWKTFFIHNYSPETGVMGDSVNGIMGPFIAIAAAILTFIAFLEQWRANKGQNQFAYDNAIENRVLNLIELHRSNVNDLVVYGYTNQNDAHDNPLKGQYAIQALCDTITAGFLFLMLGQYKDDFQENQLKAEILVYLVICHGKSLSDNPWFRESKDFNQYSEAKYINYLIYCINALRKNDFMGDSALVKAKLDQLNIQSNNLIDPTCGVINIVSRYFRQVFQIYKFIDEQTNLSYEKKYEYAKMLRSSLTNKEQELIFINMISPYGEPWIENDYIRKYKPFKNICDYNFIGYNPVTFLSKKIGIEEKEMEKYIDSQSFVEYSNALLEDK